MAIRRIYPLLAAAAILSGCAASSDGAFTRRIDLLGMPVADAAAASPATRTITITPATRWVNVTSGETVRFVAGTRSFAWNFQIGPTVSMFELNQVAPPGMFTQRIAVYVATNPLYISNS